MAEENSVLGEGSVRVELDETLYPKDAIYGAAYVFIDRCYVHLDRAGSDRITVTLRAKDGKLDSAATLGEFQNELLGQAWRLRIAEDNRQLLESVTSRALGGAAGPPGLDDLLTMSIDEDSAFEDPLGIAMSWEEKYAKKGAPAKPEANGEPAPGAEPPVADAGKASGASAEPAPAPETKVAESEGTS